MRYYQYTRSSCTSCCSKRLYCNWEVLQETCSEKGSKILQKTTSKYRVERHSSFARQCSFAQGQCCDQISRKGKGQCDSPSAVFSRSSPVRLLFVPKAEKTPLWTPLFVSFSGRISGIPVSFGHTQRVLCRRF